MSDMEDLLKHVERIAELEDTVATLQRALGDMQRDADKYRNELQNHKYESEKKMAELNERNGELAGKCKRYRAERDTARGKLTKQYSESQWYFKHSREQAAKAIEFEDKYNALVALLERKGLNTFGTMPATTLYSSINIVYNEGESGMVPRENVPYLTEQPYPQAEVFISGEVSIMQIIFKQLQRLREGGGGEVIVNTDRELHVIREALERLEEEVRKSNYGGY